jgi:hypothetical protein
MMIIKQTQSSRIGCKERKKKKKTCGRGEEKMKGQVTRERKD